MFEAHPMPFFSRRLKAPTPSARPDFVFVPGGISPTTDSGRRFASASTKGTPSLAEKTGKRLTLQVARFLDSPEAADRAFAPFYGLRDNFSNIVLSLDPVQRPRDGFRHENLRDWLLRDDPEETWPR